MPASATVSFWSAPPGNIGFGGGANLGFRQAAELGATMVALLNDDLEVEAGWLAPLRAALNDDPKLGAVQPKLLLAGSDPPRINSLGVTIGGDGAGSDIGYGEIDGPQFGDDRPIESFTGGAVLFRSQFLEETRGFDDSYFLYYEDVDLARRGARLGWTYRCVPASVVWHRVSASTSQLGRQRQVPPGTQSTALCVPIRRSSDGQAGAVAVDPPAAVEPSRHPRQGSHCRDLARPGGPSRPAEPTAADHTASFASLSAVGLSRVRLMSDAASALRP